MQWPPKVPPPPSGTHRRLRFLAPLLSTVIVVAGLAVGLVASSSRARPPSPDRAKLRRPEAAPVHLGAAVTVTDPGGDGLPSLRPTISTPLRVLEIGDSLGIDLGNQLQSQLDAGGTVTTTVASLGDTGLSNVAYYYWPAHLATLMATDRPQMVVVFLGANDDQGIDVDGTAAAPGTAPWVDAYAGRVDDLLREATNAGARVVWVGMPPMAEPDLNAAMQDENLIYQRQVASFGGTLYVSSAAVLGRPSGLYQTDLATASGPPVAVRTPDGVHLTPAGAGLLAGAVIAAVDHRWHLSV
jgi:hypothetical protein